MKQSKYSDCKTSGFANVNPTKPSTVRSVVECAMSCTTDPNQNCLSFALSNAYVKKGNLMECYNRDVYPSVSGYNNYRVFAIEMKNPGGVSILRDKEIRVASVKDTASYINDGIYETKAFSEPGCCRFSEEGGGGGGASWARIDLVDRYIAVAGRVLARKKRTGTLEKFSVNVGDPPSLKENALCYHYPFDAPIDVFTEFDYYCPLSGRFVFLSSEYNGEDMVVCEFEMFGIRI